MYVACTACKTVYPLTAAQLRAAGGKVRCGRCNTVFDAATGLSDTPEEARAFAEAMLRQVEQEVDDLVGRALGEVQHDGASANVTEDTEPDRPTEAPATGSAALATDTCRDGIDEDTHAWPAGAEFTPPPQEESIEIEQITLGGAETTTVEPPRATTPAPEAQPKPETGTGPEPKPGQDKADGKTDETQDLAAEAEEAAAMLLDHTLPESRTSWGWVLAALVLTALLLGQYAVFERNSLLQRVPALRPALEAVCQRLGCQLPMRREPARLEVLEREIRNHPNIPGALLISAIFVNTADFVQSYPVFEVRFSDVSGHTVALRRFTPAEYLPRGSDPARGMRPGQRVRVLLEVLDPGEKAVSFQFDFL